MKAADTAVLLRDRVGPLVERHRARCLWFLAEGYVPDTPEAALKVLDYIERYGDRQAFLEAEELRSWVSRLSKETSAGS